MSIKNWPENERPREKLLHRGSAALSDAELLAVLLRSGRAGMNAVDLARGLIAEFGSLRALMQADMADLTRVKGIGMAGYTQFAAVTEIGRRILREEIQTAPVFTQPQAVADYLRLQLGAEKVEVCLALLLNQQHQLIQVAEVARGTVNENTVYIREIARLALQYHAPALILAHNHPGQTRSPSAADIAFTHTLKQALALLDTVLLDHFIVTAGHITSLAQLGHV